MPYALTAVSIISAKEQMNASEVTKDNNPYE